MDFIFDPSLVLYLPFYMLDGASFMSKDKHGHLCTVTGALWQLNGRLFDGVDDKINCGSADVLDNLPNGDFTVVVVANFSAIVAGKYPDFMFKASKVYMQVQETGRLRLYVEFATTACNYLSVDNTLATKTWYQLAALYSASSKSGKLFKNANEVSYQQQQAGVGSYPGDAASDLFVGSDGALEVLSGVISELAIYKRLFTPAELQCCYLDAKRRLPWLCHP